MSDLRIDGRKFDELRNIKIQAGVLNNADGSAYIEMGKNKILSAVFGPRELHPRHLQHPLKALVRCKYNMASFSVGERKKPGPDRRSIEISKIISEALEKVILTEQFPRTTIDIFIEVIEANAGTRCAGLNAASVALADAGIPMTGLISAIACGKVDGKVVLDLCKEEDNDGDADLPIAIIPRTGEIVLLQMDGHLTEEEFNTALNLGFNACNKIYELQRSALKRKYTGGE